MEATTHSYLRGYWDSLSDYGIWVSGTQVLGCLETPIKTLMKRKCESLDVDYKSFMESIGAKP